MESDMSIARFLVAFWVSILAVGFMACSTNPAATPTEMTPVSIDAGAADTSLNGFTDAVQFGQDTRQESDSSFEETRDDADAPSDSMTTEVYETADIDTSSDDVTSIFDADVTDESVSLEDIDTDVPPTDATESTVTIRTMDGWYLEGCAGYPFDGVPACEWHNFWDGRLQELSYNTVPVPVFEGTVTEVLMFTVRNERGEYPISVNCERGTWEVTGVGNTEETMFENHDTVRRHCRGICHNGGRQLLCE